MGDMVTELDEAGVRNTENSTEQREAYNVVDDEGSPVPVLMLPSGKVSLEHVSVWCLGAFVSSKKYHWLTRATASL